MTNEQRFWMIFAGLVAVFIILRWFERRKRHKATKDELDRVVFWWSPRDPCRIRDLLNGGIAVFGRSGSGKTSSSGRWIAQAIVRNLRSGGLIVAAKPEDAELWAEIFRTAGREADLRVFGPESPLRFNFLAYVIAMGGDTREVTRCITVIGETLRSSDKKGGESADFWEGEQTRMIYMAVMMLTLAYGRVSAPEIQRLINTAPLEPGQVTTAEWQQSFCGQTIKAAFEKNKTPIQQHDFDLASDYWLNEFATMCAKTRSNILTGVMGILFVFNSGIVRELVSTTTNCSPDDMLAGKWILVNMPAAEWGDSGAFIAAGWKYLTQRRILRRAAKDGDCINVIWVDEAQTAVNSYDAHYLAQCRSHRGCMVYLTQSIHSYNSAMKGEVGKHQVGALLANFACATIFHALGDHDTAETAQKLLGRRRETFVGTSMAPVDNLWEEISGASKVTMSSSEHYEPVLQTNVFMNGLRTGGAANDFICDSIVVRSGEPFASGENYLVVAWPQRG